MQPMKISYQFSSKSTTVHNNREGKYVEREEHVIQGGEFKIYKDEEIKKAYDLLFKKSAEEYNSTQKRQDRMIENYYQKIKKSKTKKVCYEVVLQIGSLLNHPKAEDCQKIFEQYIKVFQKRNPNLYVTQAVYHNDERAKIIDEETGEEKWIKSIPHAHIQFVPFFKSEKGMKFQNGLNGAFKAMGFEKKGKKIDGLFNQWKEREKAFFTQLCEKEQMNIDISKGGRRVHYEPKQYRSMKVEQQMLKYAIRQLEKQMKNKQPDIVVLQTYKDLEQKVESYSGSDNTKLKSELKNIKESMPDSLKLVLEYEGRFSSLSKRVSLLEEEGRKKDEKIKALEEKNASFDTVMDFLIRRMPKTWEIMKRIIPKKIFAKAEQKIIEENKGLYPTLTDDLQTAKQKDQPDKDRNLEK